MRTLPARVERRMHVAAQVLTPRLQEHAIARGVPDHVARGLQVQWTGNGFDTTVSDPRLEEAYDEHEWGSPEEPPKAFARTFEPELDKAFKETLHQAILAHIGGER